MYFWHSVGNKSLTLVTNILFDTTLTDMETCYKVFTAEVARPLRLRSERWGIDPEITAKILKQRHRIYEVPIAYNGREFWEGKKISWKRRLRRPRHPPPLPLLQLALALSRAARPTSRKMPERPNFVVLSPSRCTRTSPAIAWPSTDRLAEPHGLRTVERSNRCVAAREARYGEQLAVEDLAPGQLDRAWPGVARGAVIAAAVRLLRK